MNDRFIKFESEREDPLDSFEDELFLEDRRRAVWVVLVGCLLGAIVLVIWR